MTMPSLMVTKLID